MLSRSDEIVKSKQNEACAQRCIYLVLTADDRYAMPLAVTICSVIQNLSRSVYLTIFVVDGGISIKNRNKIMKSIDSDRSKIEWIEPNANIIRDIKLPQDYHLTISSCLRLFIPSFVPDHIHKIIYLDCDLIVNGDLKKLWDINIDEYYLAAAQDMGISHVSSPSGLINYKELGFSAERKYFNSGVLLINLTKWRRDDLPQQAVDYLNRNSDYVRWLDQDALNVVSGNQWKELDPTWNQQPSIYMYESVKESPFSETTYKNLVESPYIVHFVHYKPWNSTVPHPYREEFYKYLDMTAWLGWRYKLHQRLRDKATWKWKKLISLAKSIFLNSKKI